MINISYSITAPLQQQLYEIEQLRAALLLTPLSIEQEASLKTQVMIDRIFYALQLVNIPLVRQQVVKLLSTQNTRNGPFAPSAFNYKNGFDYIRYDWYVTSEPITQKTLSTLNKLVTKGKVNSTPQEIDRFLQYIQYGDENPIIQSALAHLLLISLSPFSEGNAQTAYLFTYLILYRYGYDFRGLLGLEEYFYTTPKAYEYNLSIAQQTGQTNIWLDYFVTGVSQQLKKALQELKQPGITIAPSMNQSHLNDRQKQILILLEQPGKSLRNKHVQDQFKVSQITASRDLSELAKLGLIRLHGQGRSTYYTKF